MKAVENQQKNPIGYDYQCFCRRAFRPVLIQFFYAIKKNNKNKSIKTRQKTLSKPKSHILALKI